MLALHKYYLRAEYMREHFSRAREQLVAKHGEEGLRIRTASTERFQAEMYLDYWCAAIFVAVEGYEKLGLNDPEVEKLRNDPLFTKLRSYRAGTYHFREKYFDDAVRDLLQSANSASWLVQLDMALGHFLLAELDRRKRALVGGDAAS